MTLNTKDEDNIYTNTEQ